MTWKTLPDLLAYNAETYPDLLFIRFLKRGEIVATCTYAQAFNRAASWAALLTERGLQQGEAVLLALPNSDDFVYAYFGTLLAGGVPAPTAPIRHLKTNSYYLVNVAQRLQSIDGKVLIVPETQANIASLPPLSTIENLTILTRQDVQPASHYNTPTCSEHNIGLLQFTSGTSGNSKVVQLSNAALLAQMRNISAMLAVDHNEDSAASWLPLFHDMGMIGFLLTSMYRAIPLSLLLTEDFMMRPNLWIKALSDFRATITAGPPSAYALCARYLKDSEIEDYDLQHLRLAMIGAEMISPESLRQFADKLRPSGFRAKSLLLAYGLAENGLAVTMTSLNQEPEFETIHLETMHTKGIAQPAQHLNGVNGTTRDVACVGSPLPQTQVAIVNQLGERLGERQVGEVLVSSPSLMAGYYGQLETSNQALRNGWLWTGDLGYIANDRLYITGRKKEVLIVGGRNYYPDDLEQVAIAAADVRPGNIVAISYQDPARATEAVVVLVETTVADHVGRDALRQRIRQALIEADYPISEVLLLRPKTIQTTPNGKLKRVDIKVRYLKGEFSHDN